MSSAELVSPDGANRWLREALGLSNGDTPFPWQEEILARFANGTIERALDIPTGLGKTAVMAIWLVARARGAVLPRRLVYVVDRRAVVDQATDVASGLREYVDRNPGFKKALGLGARSLPISTLRGQHVDNREWLEDPALSAIIVGTVDMIGSRLFFEGYGTSRKMRPYQAGLLGADTLVVLDEAHLVPPFEKLLETVADGDAVFGPSDRALRNLIPTFKLLCLSATGRTLAGTAFELQEADLKHFFVRRRLDAPKRLTLAPLDNHKLADVLAEQAWKLSGNGTRAMRIIVFCDKRKDAEDTKKAVEKLAKGDKKAGSPTIGVHAELLVGGRRVFEREAAAQWLKGRGFIAGAPVERLRPAFVFATSAGEVGVDLDADHMVSDLVAWERMVQRLGRVNRRGDGKADVVVVVEPDPDNFKDALEKAPEKRTKREKSVVEAVDRLKAVQTLLDRLPRKDGAADASPGALRALKQSAQHDSKVQAVLDAATTPAPLRPALSRALVDAWSMTSLKEHTGRPEVEPWLRGWIEDDKPQTGVVWRTHLPVRTRGRAATSQEIEAFFEAAPPHASEILETETYRVVEWLAARAKDLAGPPGGQPANGVEPVAKEIDDAESGEPAGIGDIEGLDETDATEIDDRAGNDYGERAAFSGNDLLAFVLTAAGDLGTSLPMKDLLDGSDKKVNEARRAALERNLCGATLVVDARMGGLKDGLLDHAAKDRPCTVDDGKAWMPPLDSPEPVVRFRVRVVGAGEPAALDKQWRERLRFATDTWEDGEPTRWLVVEKWRHDATTEEDRSAGRPQMLDEHQEWAEGNARDLASRLSLPGEYVEMLAIAARLHDEGKRAKRWQSAFKADKDGVYAKTRGPVNIALLDRYRHEFGSLPFAIKNERLNALPDELRDLALHLIAAHHGFARPLIGTDGCEDAPPSALAGLAQEVALRFARLQKRWGPWGLAWWEALLRAADQQASRENDAADSVAAKERV